MDGLSRDDWLPITCAMCRTHLRIKQAYAHMRGHCPECGGRIRPIQPRPAPPPDFSTSDEPLGLLPDDEEWPEPAEVVEAPPPSTGPLPPPSDPAALPPTTPAKPIQIFGFASSPAGSDNPSETTRPFPHSTPAALAAGAGTPHTASPATVLPIAPSADAAYEVVDEPADEASPPGSKPAAPPVEEITLETDPTTFLSAATIPASLLPRAKPLGHVADVPLAEVMDNSPPEEPLAPPVAGPSPVSSDLVSGSPPEPGNKPIPLEALYATYRLSDAELAPKRPQPPRRPFLDGIATFPFRPQNAVPFVTLLFGSWIWLVIIILLLLAWESVHGGGPLVVGAALPFLLLAAGWVGIWTASWSAAYFVTAVEETAAGNDQVDWPEGSWRDWFFALLKLGFVFLFWLALPYRLLTWLGFRIAAYVCFPITLLIFPVSLLCAMTDGKWYVLVNRKLLGRLLRRPKVLLCLYAYWLPLGAASLVLGGLTMTSFNRQVELGPNILIAFGVALLWSATLLISGRVLGRVGWVLSQPLRSTRRRNEPKNEPAAKPLRGDGSDFWTVLSGRP